MDLLRHFLFPQVSNNYRAKALHTKVLIILILFFFFGGLLISTVKNNYPQVLGISSDISIDQLLILTNQQRQQNGLPALVLDNRLDQAATAKATDMFAKGYWAHVAPDGTTPWMFIKNEGYTYVYAGENLARGYTTSTDVVNAWMASPSHRENMLSNHYNNVGYAVLTGNLSGEDTVLVVQMFGSTTLAVENNLVQNTKSVEEISPTQIPIPTSIPTPMLVISPAEEIQKSSNTATSDVVSKKQIIAKISNPEIKPLINSANFSSDIARVTVTIFIFILILDMLIIERKKIVRFVGHNLDHVIFLLLILSLILIILKGYVI